MRGTGESSNPPGTRKHSPSAETAASDPLPGRKRPAADPLAEARQDHVEEVERQLEEISAPLAEDMASTMFHADIPEGQSLVTGGYQTADGRNQFTILKPQRINGKNGQEMIRIDSKMIAMSPQDTTQSGLDSLATKARNTLQHAESWEESDVASAMEKIQNSTGSELMSAPSVILMPGQDFSVEISSDDKGSFTLKGTAQASPTGPGVVVKARIEHKETPATR